MFSWTPCNCSLEKWKATIGQGRGLVKWLSSCWTSKVWQRAADHPSNHCRLNHALEQPFQVPSFENSLTQQTFFKQLSFANDQWRPKGLQEAVLRDNPFFSRMFYSVFKYWPSKYFDQAWCFCWTALLLCNFYSDKYFRKHNSFMFSKKLLWEKYYCGALFKGWGGSRDLANKE